MKLTHLVAVGVGLLAAACAGDGTGPGDLTTLDASVALFTADAAGQDIELMRGPGGRFGLGLAADPGSFECGTIERPGMIITRTCTFYDADGLEQSAYDDVTTDSVVMHVEMSGSLDRGDWETSSMSRVRDIAVTGLAGAETTLTWNATGSGTMSRIHQTRDGSDVLMEMTSSETATGVVIPVPRTPDGWPLGGTIATHVSMTVTGGPHEGTHERDVTITFDGTQYARVTVDGETFTIDLANREHRDGRHGPGGRGPGGPGGR